MGKRRGSSPNNHPPEDRSDSWKMIFKGLVDLIQDQQRQIESLAKERKSLEKRIQSQHERWVSDVKLSQDHISQMMRDSKIKDMIRFVDTAKANLIISMKQKEAIMHKLKFEDVDDERIDLKLLFDDLSQCLAEPKRATRSSSKNIDESALKAERDFAWNQFKKTDAKLQEHVKRTKSEVGAANEKIQKLMSDLEHSQSENVEKNRTISTLQDGIAMLELDSRKKSEEISRLTKELELLRGGSVTPVLRRCMAESDGSEVKDKKSDSKGRRSSKRKAGETEPRLFTSRFKVPKLKNSSAS